eukprot:6173869-Pleurochrysis_carterae.AAC.1
MRAPARPLAPARARTNAPIIAHARTFPSKLAHPHPNRRIGARTRAGTSHKRPLRSRSRSKCARRTRASTRVSVVVLCPLSCAVAPIWAAARACTLDGRREAPAGAGILVLDTKCTRSQIHGARRRRHCCGGRHATVDSDRNRSTRWHTRAVTVPWFARTCERGREAAAVTLEENFLCSLPSQRESITHTSGAADFSAT